MNERRSLPSLAESQFVLLGASEFPLESDLPPLASVRHNVDDLSIALKDGGILGTLDQQLSVHHNPSRDELLDAISNAAHAAKDLLFIYYSGHGIRCFDSEDLFLATSRSLGQVNLYKDAVRFGDVQSILRGRKSGARRKLMIVDCCWSGLALGVTMSAGDPSGELLTSGVCVVASTARDRTSKSPRGERNTAFTGKLLELLNFGADIKDTLLDVQTIHRILESRLLSAGHEKPWLLAVDHGANIVIARNVRRQPREKTKRQREQAQNRRRRGIETVVRATIGNWGFRTDHFSALPREVLAYVEQGDSILGSLDLSVFRTNGKMVFFTSSGLGYFNRGLVRGTQWFIRYDELNGCVVSPRMTKTLKFVHAPVPGTSHAAVAACDTLVYDGLDIVSDDRKLHIPGGEDTINRIGGSIAAVQRSLKSVLGR